MSKYNKDMGKFVKKMGYTSYYVKKISSIKGKKNKEKYLFKLLTKYGKFHNLKCDLKCISIKQKYQSGGSETTTEMSAFESLAFLEKGLKSLDKIKKLDKIKIKSLANDKENLQTNIEKLKEFSKKKEKKIEQMKEEKTILQTEKKNLADKNTLSISKIKELKDYKLKLITALLLLLQTKLYLFQQLFNPYKDLITLLELLRKEGQSQGIYKKVEGFNERLDFYTIKVSDLKKTLYNGFYLKCQLFKKFGIPIITADFDAIEITDGNYLGWKDNNLDTIIYKKKGEYVNAKGTTIKYTKVTAPENINISTFDTIYTDIDVLDNIDEIKICVGYNIEDKDYDYLPFSQSLQTKIVPIYKKFVGWNTSTFGLKNWSDLPKNAQTYIDTIEEMIETDISIISTGPERTQTIDKKKLL